MRIAIATTLSLLALAACSPSIPDSGAGVGETTTYGTSSLPPVSAVAAAPLDSDAAAIAADTAAMLETGPSATGAPLSAMAADASTNVVAATPAAISDEQSFEAVSSRETIESDAARIAENRAQYVVIEPTDLPPRPDGSGASIVAYALATNHAPGQPLYNRSGLFADSRYERSCGKYASPNRAQEAFLDAGGPKRDRYGMDPDGDGFACDWDPRPFRAARGGAPEIVEVYDVVETPGES